MLPDKTYISSIILAQRFVSLIKVKQTVVNKPISWDYNDFLRFNQGLRIFSYTFFFNCTHKNKKYLTTTTNTIDFIYQLALFNRLCPGIVKILCSGIAQILVLQKVTKTPFIIS